jgi:hypothetical protein
MITSVVSTATRLSLAPARLVGRLAGSLLGELRGNGATANARREHSSTRAKPARRTRAKAQPKPATSRTHAKAQPKRPAGRTRTKAQPKRADSGTSTKAQTPAPTRTNTPAPQRKTGSSPATPEDRAVGQGETSAEVPAPASELHTGVRAADGKPGGQPPVGSGGGAANEGGNESLEQEGRQPADHPADPGPGNGARSRRGSDHTASEDHTPRGG